MEIVCRLLKEMSSSEAMVAAVERYWNAFTLEGKMFELGMSHWAEQGKKYRICVTSLPKYARHLDKPNLRKFRVREKRYFWQEYGRDLHSILYLSFSMNWETRELHDDVTIFVNLTEETFAEKSTEAGKKLAELHLSVLQQEAQWDSEWRVMWGARKDHVLLALLAFFKGESIDTWKEIYMLFQTFWLAEAH